MFEPTNEQGTIALFCTQLAQSGWEIVSIRTAFPDAILMKNNEEWRVEFEFKSRNFISHAHDFRECDLIICWEDDFPECPIPVIEIRNPEWIDAEPQKGNPLIAQIDYWRNRAIRAEAKVSKLRKTVEIPVVLDEGPIGKQIVRYLLDNPGAKLEDIAGHVGRSVPSVSKEVSALVDADVLHSVKEGRRKILTANGRHEEYLQQS